MLLPAITALAGGELKIVYNVGVAPLKFEDTASRAVGLFPDLWQLWAQKSGKQIKFVRTASFKESLQLLKDGRIVGAVVSFMDITERRQMERELLQAKEKAEALKLESEAMAPLCDKLVQLAEDFDFDSIQKIVGDLADIS